MGQAGLPGDRPLGLAQRLALDVVDELLELVLGDRLVGLLAFLAVGRREALDELAGDADDDLARPEAGHLLGLLEGDRAVVDDGRDVGDGARLHVRRGPGACARRRGPCRARRRRSRRRAPWRTRCRRRARCRRRGSRPRRVARSRRQKAISPPRRCAGADARSRSAASASASPSRRVPLPWAICGRPPPLAPSGPAAALTRSPAAIPRSTRSSETVTKTCGSSASRARAMTPDAERVRGSSLAAALSVVHRFVRDRPRRRGGRPGRPPRPGRPARPAVGRPAAAAGLEPALRLAQLVLERGDAVLDGVDRLRADRLGDALQRLGALAREAVRRGPGDAPRCGACRSRCSARR